MSGSTAPPATRADYASPGPARLPARPPGGPTGRAPYVPGCEPASGGRGSPCRHRQPPEERKDHPCGASCACRLPKAVRTQQSCAGASNNDDDRDAPGHRGGHRPRRLCDRPAAIRPRPALRSLAGVAASGRQGRGAGRTGSGAGGAGARRATTEAFTGSVPGRGATSPRRARAGRAAGARPTSRAGRAAPRTETAPTRPPRRPASGDESAEGPGRVRPRQEVRGLEAEQSRGGHLQGRVRPLTRPTPRLRPSGSRPFGGPGSLRVPQALRIRGLCGFRRL